MTTHKDWFSIDLPKRAARVRSHALAHVLKELLANSLDAGATRISLECLPVEGTRVDRLGCRAFAVTCEDDGAGCADPGILRRVGSTTSDQSPTKRGRFGHGLIDVVTIAEHAEIRTHAHRLVFGRTGCAITTLRSAQPGLRFSALIRHPDGDFHAIERYFRSVILPEQVHFAFNGALVPHRAPVRTIGGVALPTPQFDPRTERVRERALATDVRLVEAFAKEPMIHEMGIPVDRAGWSLPYDIDVLQKTPLDIERVMLPDRYRRALISALVGPTSDLYAAHCREHDAVPHEIRDDPENAARLSTEAQDHVIRVAVSAERSRIVRRNPLDVDDRSNAQELEIKGYVPVNRAHLPSGIAGLLADAPTVARMHDEVCKAHTQADPDFPPETDRQRKCLAAFAKIASALLGYAITCGLMRGCADGGWRNGMIRLNTDHAPLWDDPLGAEALGIILHECAHASVSGHAQEFADEVARLGGKLAGWVGADAARWDGLHSALYRA